MVKKAHSNVHVERVIGIAVLALALALTSAGCSSSVATRSLSVSRQTTAQTTAALQTPESQIPDEVLPSTVASSIPDDAVLVGKDYAQTSEGSIVDVETGKKVTDPEIVGTEDTPPDPLAKSDGTRFIPVAIDAVRNQVGDSEQDSQGSVARKTPDTISQSSVAPSVFMNFLGTQKKGNNALFSKTSAAQDSHRVNSVALQNSSYGPYWGSAYDTSVFFNKYDSPFAYQAKGVIDVSQWQGTIDWNAVKASGVQGAIIRIGYGFNQMDPTAVRNISECKRLDIPFGIYFFSYATTANEGTTEANGTISLLKKAGVKPSDLSYPVFYDLENWSITGSKSPTSTAVYEGIVNSWYWGMLYSGYSNEQLGVYSYTWYLNSTLNSTFIHSKTSWAAEYGPKMNFTRYGSDYRGWQYQSEGRVSGISGNVDLNAFGDEEYKPVVSLLWQPRDDYMAVGASVKTVGTTKLEYQWQVYNLSTKEWRTIAGWNASNWAGWADSVDNYWLHVDVRNANTKKVLATKTINFRYAAGYTDINGTYAGTSKDGVLLGVNSNNPKAKYITKIYNYDTKKWVAQFNGKWATWHPTKGTYWTHYESYTSDGRLGGVRTYAFGVK
jgi:GH25 family lysozyme M1 (1,4-beta-N-acetylmuramidase)